MCVFRAFGAVELLGEAVSSPPVRLGRGYIRRIVGSGYATRALREAVLDADTCMERVIDTHPLRWIIVFSTSLERWLSPNRWTEA